MSFYGFSGHSAYRRSLLCTFLLSLLIISAVNAFQDGPARHRNSSQSVEGRQPIYLSPYDFQERGDWGIHGFKAALQLAALTGPIHRNPEGLKPAEATFKVKQEGVYALWVRSLDFAENQQGARFFYVESNGNVLSKRLGSHGHNGFRWELVESVHLKQGENSIRLIDSSAFYPRCDGVFLTPDQTLDPNDVDSMVTF